MKILFCLPFPAQFFWWCKKVALVKRKILLSRGAPGWVDRERNDQWPKCLFRKPIFYDKFTLLYESDTLPLLHFTNGNILHCVVIKYWLISNCHHGNLHCLRQIRYRGHPFNFFGKKGSRYSLPPPRLLETVENSFSSFNFIVAIFICSIFQRFFSQPIVGVFCWSFLQCIYFMVCPV